MPLPHARVALVGDGTRPHPIIRAFAAEARDKARASSGQVSSSNA